MDDVMQTSVHLEDLSEQLRCGPFFAQICSVNSAWEALCERGDALLRRAPDHMHALPLCDEALSDGQAQSSRATGDEGDGAEL